MRNSDKKNQFNFCGIGSQRLFAILQNKKQHK